MAAGRPSIYSEELAKRICTLVATNPVGLPTLCRMYPELPTRETINVWRWEKRDFSDMYTKAKQHQAEIMAESIEEVAQELKDNSYVDDLGLAKIDSGMLGHARLVCDNRKWTAARLAPKIYGDQKQLESLQDENAKVKADLEALRIKFAEEHKKDY